MDICQLSNSFTVRKLDTNDVDEIYELMRKNTLYYRYHPPFVTKQSIVDDMKALPPQKNYDDKYFVGFFDDTQIVAVMDLVLDYPSEHTAFIGFFMVDKTQQGKGIGTKIIKAISKYLKTNEFRFIRLGVDRGNPQSNSFWTKNNFRKIAENDYIIMELTL